MGTIGGLLMLVGLGLTVRYGNADVPWMNKGEVAAAVFIYVGSACVAISAAMWLWSLL